MFEERSLSIHLFGGILSNLKKTKHIRRAKMSYNALFMRPLSQASTVVPI